MLSECSFTVRPTPSDGKMPPKRTSLNHGGPSFVNATNKDPRNQAPRTEYRFMFIVILWLICIY